LAGQALVVGLLVAFALTGLGVPTVVIGLLAWLPPASATMDIAGDERPFMVFAASWRTGRRGGR
jgi:hypothetical protein